METSINSNINQLYMSSARLFASATSAQQLDAKLIAFYTILTVALSIMLSFKQSRCMLINATTTYPLFKVKKCLKCLKGFKVTKIYRRNKSSSNEHSTCSNINNKTPSSSLPTSTSSSSSINNNSDSLNYHNSNYYLSYSKYLKLKRLRNIASIATKFTSNTLKLNSYYYLFKKINATFSKMKKFRRNKTAAMQPMPSSNIQASNNHNRKNFFRFRFRNSTCSANDEYCPTCETSAQIYESATILASSISSPEFGLNNNKSNLKSIVSMGSFSSSDKNRPLPKLNSKVRLYKKLPLRTMSRAWGEINSIDLPVWCRKPCYYLYSWVFSCNLNEMEIEDLKEYKNLSEFFRRTLKPDARVIDQISCLISPCDGKILHFGRVEKGYLEQVKGVNYSLRAFLGEMDWPHSTSSSLASIDTGISSNYSNNNNNPIRFTLNDESYSDQSLNEDYDEHFEYQKKILHNPDNCLYHCVIYLAPGDYHRFHSPSDWNINYRRHFPGELFSVNPSVARWLQGLFNLNERVVYYGNWKYGFFSMTPVGATNVGSIKVYMDEELTTNNKLSRNFEINLEKSFTSSTLPNGVSIKRGELFGEFNLGSTIVLIFEAPKDFEFNIKQNDRVFYGSQLGASSNLSSKL